MKNLFHHVFIPGIVLILLSSKIYPQELTLKLCLEKKIYLTGGPAYALAELSNNSSPVKVQPLQLVSCMVLI